MTLIKSTDTESHYFGNTVSFVFEQTDTGSRDVNLTNVIFDNLAGNYQNFTNLSMNETATAPLRFTINWTTNSSILPTNYNSLEQKFVEIENISSTVSLDSIVWHWTDAELAGYTESNLELWKYNGSWSNAGATLSEAANTLTLTNMNPASDYGILENNNVSNDTISDCTVISSPGVYTLGSDVAGASNYINPPSPSCYTWSNRYVCIHIVSSDVTLDCNGHTITGNDLSGFTPAYGIYVGNDTGTMNNITIHNCTVQNYSQGGIYLSDANSSSVYNNTVNSTRPGTKAQFGIYLDRNHNVSVYDNYAFNSSSSLFEMCHSENNTFRNNTAYLSINWILY